MSKIGVIIKNEIKQRLKRKGFWISTFLFPLMFLTPLFVSSKVSEISPPGQKLLVINDKTGQLLGQLVANLSIDQSIKPVAFKLYDEQTLSRIHRDIQDGVFWGLLELEQTSAIGISAKLFYSGQENPEKLHVLRQAVELAAKDAAIAKMSIPENEKSLLNQYNLQFSSKHQAPKTDFDDGLSKYVISYIAGLLMYITMLIYGIQVMNAIIFEKSTRIMEVLISSITPKQLMAAKIGGVGLVGLIQYMIWGMIFIGIALSLSSKENSLFQGAVTSLSLELVMYLVVFFVAGYLMYASMYAAIGAMVEEQQDAQTLHMPITFLIVLPVLILPQVISTPNALWVKVLSFIPFFTPTLMVTRLAAGSVSLLETGLAILFVLMAFYLINTLAGKIYRVGVLSYGQKPTFKTILGYLKD